MQKTGLFFIAVLPDFKIQDEVTTFKKYAAAYFQSQHALKSPPHITLIPPFRWELSRWNQLQESLSDFVKEQQTFHLKLKNFDCFAPRVIFVDVEEQPILNQLQKQLHMYLKEHLGLINNNRPGFHPHMTIAFKDLKKSVFPMAWAYFSAQVYERTFEVQQLHLLQHNSKRWTIKQEFGLSGSLIE